MKIITSSSSLLLLLVVVGLMSLTRAQTPAAQDPIVDEADCGIPCQNDSTCRAGEQTYADHPKQSDGQPFSFHRVTSVMGHYCDCPPNWTGIRCGREYEVCPPGPSGKQHFCYHGGACLDGMEDSIAEDLQFCDCSKAAHNGIPMRGKNCELEASNDKDGDGVDDPIEPDSDEVPVVFCDPNTKQFFCYNGGTCKDGFMKRERYCDCLEGHRGPHCEFEHGHVPECDLTCENSGECRLGIKEYDDKLLEGFWDNHENYMTCDCPEGYFGNKCEKEGVPCGDKTCFNGAACEQALNVNGESAFVCDCRTADTNTISFAGDFCQSESTSFCTKTPGSNGHLFCTNGGTCKEDEHLGCECQDGFHGPICEFSDAQPEDECSLICHNGGQCRSGIKDNSYISSFGTELVDYNKTHNGYWEHCVCPNGYFGIQCEHELQICPGGNHVCLHGSQCVPENEHMSIDELTHYCDCDAGFDAVERYAGKFCQYSSTDICTKNGKPGVGKANFAFCVNNGSCKARVTDSQPHPGCNCPDGFAGDHCEYLEGHEPGSTTKTTKFHKGGQSLILGLGIVAVLLLIAVTLVILRRSLTGKETDSGGNSTPPPVPTKELEPSGPTPFDTEEEMTTEGPTDPDPEMKTVEIL